MLKKLIQTEETDTKVSSEKKSKEPEGHAEHTSPVKNLAPLEKDDKKHDKNMIKNLAKNTINNTINIK